VIYQAGDGVTVKREGALPLRGSDSCLQLQIRWLEALVTAELLDCWLRSNAPNLSGRPVSLVQGEPARLIRKPSVKALPVKDSYPLREQRCGFASVLLSRVLNDRAK
jgi:hypothetical protein